MQATQNRLRGEVGIGGEGMTLRQARDWKVAGRIGNLAAERHVRTFFVVVLVTVKTANTKT